MKWPNARRQREAEAAEAAARQAEHTAIRERLLATVDRTGEYADDLLAEVHRWTSVRKDHASD